MTTLDEAIIIGCGVVAILILLMAFRDNRRLEDVGVLSHYRVIIFIANVASAVMVLLVGVLFWLTRTNFWGLAVLWFFLFVGLGGALFATYKVWSEAWDAVKSDVERRH